MPVASIAYLTIEFLGEMPYRLCRVWIQRKVQITFIKRISQDHVPLQVVISWVEEPVAKLSSGGRRRRVRSQVLCRMSRLRSWNQVDAV